jgi:hypothetical protein
LGEKEICIMEHYATLWNCLPLGLAGGRKVGVDIHCILGVWVVDMGIGDWSIVELGILEGIEELSIGVGSIGSISDCIELSIGEKEISLPS